MEFSSFVKFFTSADYECVDLKSITRRNFATDGRKSFNGRNFIRLHLRPPIWGVFSFRVFVLLGWNRAAFGWLRGSLFYPKIALGRRSRLPYRPALV
jgi:hypothetical protein